MEKINSKEERQKRPAGVWHPTAPAKKKKKNSAGLVVDLSNFGSIEFLKSKMSLWREKG